MNVTATRLGNTPAEIGYALTFFSAPEIVAALPDADRSPYSAYNAAKAVEQGACIAYVPMCDSVPVGLFWGTWLSSTTIVGHWGVLTRHLRHGLTQGAMQAVCELLHKEFPTVTNIMGFTPVCNRAAYAGALRCGFTKVGILPKSHVSYGKFYDSWILVKEIAIDDADAK